MENTLKHTPTTTWFTRPAPEHVVQFYASTADLLSPLCEYLIQGIASRETCIVIAGKRHSDALLVALTDRGVDIASAEAHGFYTCIAAESLMDKFIVNDVVGRTQFFAEVGGLVHSAIRRGRPVRAYGEMVALLWQEGRVQAVLELEKLWNELAEQHEFSLYCAYPKLHFLFDKTIRREITHQHAQNVSAPAAE